MWRELWQKWRQREKPTGAAVHRAERMMARPGFLQRFKLHVRGVWLHWDRYPKDGTVLRPYCGVIEIAGWAVAPSGISSIEISCDGERLGMATLGLRRRDLFRLFPHVRSARRSGFQFLLDTTRLSNGHHQLVIRARSNVGRTTSLSAPICVKNLATRYDRFRRQTTPNAAALAWMRRNVLHLPYRPRVSLILKVVASVTSEDLAGTIQSLAAQVYDNWQLILPTAIETGAFAHDPRIQVDTTPDGEWLGFLDPGDVLHPHAIFELIYQLNRDSNCELIYSDDETMGTPYFKSDWTLGLFLRGQIPGRLWLARDPQWSRKQLHGSEAEQEFLEELAAKSPRIVHVPRILCTRKRPAQNAIASQPLPDQPLIMVHAPCPQIERENVKSILVVKLDHLGDVLLSIPAMRRLRELCPEARITALVGSWARPLMEAEPCVDELLTYDYFAASSSEGCRRMEERDLRQIKELFGGRHFDLAVDLRRESDTREFLQLSGAAHTVGYANRGENDWLTIAIPWDDIIAVQMPRRHVSLDALRLVETLALAARADVITDYRLTVPDDAEVKQLLLDRLPAEPGMLVGLHPGAGRAIKCWPADRFAKIADRFVNELAATVILFGTETDATEVNRLLQCVQRRDRLVSFAHELRLPQFMAMLKHVDFFIGNDSGPTHMAAATGIPTLGVYAATIDATQWAPLGQNSAVIQRRMLCSPCYLAKKQDCPYQVACLQEISVQDVWDAAMRVLLPKWSHLALNEARCEHSD